MALIDFKAQFVPAVADGTKKQTIRKNHKAPVRIGDNLHLYTGLGTINFRQIAITTCQSICDITVYERSIKVDGVYLSSHEISQFVKDEGFSGVEEFYYFFKNNHGLPFTGKLIKWDDIKK